MHTKWAQRALCWTDPPRVLDRTRPQDGERPASTSSTAPGGGPPEERGIENGGLALAASWDSLGYACKR